jgi:ADP-heptose:LPS heptosyltransferase
LNYPIKIGVALGGGIGDYLNLSAMLHGLKRKFPQSIISIYIVRYPEVFKDNRVVNFIHIKKVSTIMRDVERDIPKYHIFAEVRYPVKYSFSGEALGHPEIAEFRDEWQDKYDKKYRHMWESFLQDIPAMDRFCEKNRMTAYDVRRDSSCLDYTEADQFISITDQDLRASSSLEGLRVVTVNNSGAYCEDMTKSWTDTGWSKVVQHLKQRGVYVVQIGTGKERPIPGVSERFVGSLHETVAIMKRSMFHVGIEGGFVHLGKALGHRSVVMFGPTPVPTFGYPENINLRSSFCSPCWWGSDWKTLDWNKTCRLTGRHVSEQTPQCMSALSPAVVIEAVDKLLCENKILSDREIKHV